ncbi:MAG TPA: metallophosphoesterase family protein [Thermoleophilaceae bacterium]|jgi:predicted phosphodiesterase
MRYGVAGDVHGNLEALRSVLAALEAAGAERIVCPGDVVGYGPDPDACAELLAERDALVVAGNHDLMATGELPVEGTGGIVRRTIEWTRGAIASSTRAWLAELPLELTTGDGVLVTHGAIGDPTRYVRDEPAARAQLGELARREPAPRGLLIGHTHHPMSFSAGGRWLLNAGSVGQSRERRPLARALVFDSGAAAESAEFLALDYDARATRARLRAAGLPPHACHLAPGRIAHLRRRVASLAGEAAR